MLFRSVNQGYLMAERVKKYHTGLAVSPDNTDEILKAIGHLLNGLDDNGIRLSPKFKEYTEMHSQKYLNVAFTEILNG